MSDTATRALRGRGAFLRLLGRHQIASLVSTVVDYSVMVLAVSAAGLSPVCGTVLGASAGGATNFALSRRWVFADASAGPVRGQALRYAFVSLCGLLLNAAGEYLLHNRFGMQYFIARVVISVAVSLGWNLPLQRHFVFRRR